MPDQIVCASEHSTFVSLNINLDIYSWPVDDVVKCHPFRGCIYARAAPCRQGMLICTPPIEEDKLVLVGSNFGVQNCTFLPLVQVQREPDEVHGIFGTLHRNDSLAAMRKREQRVQPATKLSVHP